MAKKFGGAKQKCMQRIRWRLQTFKLSTLLSIFFRSNLQMGKAKEGSGVGEECQNGDLADRRVDRGEKKEEQKHQPDVAAEEQHRMNRWGHPHTHHYHHLPQHHHHCHHPHSYHGTMMISIFMIRSGCLPAIIYLTTPILVTLFAWILHCW